METLKHILLQFPHQVDQNWYIWFVHSWLLKIKAVICIILQRTSRNEPKGDYYEVASWDFRTYSTFDGLMCDWTTAAVSMRWNHWEVCIYEDGW